MGKTKLIMASLAVLAVVGLLVSGVFAFRLINSRGEKAANNNELIGGQKDDHGCLIAAGYSWCEVKNKCLRTWEEPCEAGQAEGEGAEPADDDGTKPVDSIAVEPTESDIGSIKQAFIDKYKKSQDEVQITIAKFDGKFARGGVKFSMNGQPGEGGIFLAYKEENVWKLAFDGNGMFDCQAMETLGFSADLIGDCADHEQAETSDKAQLPNPASVYCAEQGGRLEIRTKTEGQYGVCILKDGTECDEWAFFRGECALP